MKVYIYYLTIPESPSEKFNKTELERFEVVRSQFNKDHFKQKPGVVVNVNGIERYLYAFTTDKELAKDFEFIHSMFLFTKLEKKMNSEDYRLFEKDMDHAKLQYFEMDDHLKRSMLLTKMENYILDDSYQEVEILLSNYSCLGYDFFKRKYIRALDLLLYTTYYQLNGPDAEFYDHNWSYGCTPEGASDNGLTSCLNYQNMYVDIFKLILK